MARQFAIAIILFAFLMGSIGGLGTAVYSGASWPIVASIVVLIVLAAPTAWGLFKEWQNY